MMMVKRFGMVALAAIAFSACSEDGGTGPVVVAPEYNLTVSGEVAASLHGAAYFGADTNDQGEQVFALLMGGDTSSYVVVLSRSGTVRPGVGEYDIGSPDENGWVGTLFTAQGEELTGMFVSEEGDMTVHESTTARFRGFLDFTASGFLGDDVGVPAEVRITGTFDARPISQMQQH